MYQKFNRYHLLLLFLILVLGCNNTPQPAPYVNNIDSARSLLAKERAQVLQELEQKVTPANISRLVDLGLWDEAQNYISKADTSQDSIKLVQASLLIKKHQYFKAETKVEAVLADERDNRQAQLLRAKLYIQSWELDKAEQIAQSILENDSEAVEAGRICGRIAMFKRNYDEALQWAGKIQGWNSDKAAGYLLEAETLFWSENAAAAEPALRQALDRAPFNVDARFSYGYAIWRRVDATLLDEMAAQWNFALTINPLHYLTHWHFGNGHTNLTYADYAMPSDSLVRSKLAEADAMVAEEKLDKAITMTREIGTEFPKSVLPAMMRGSVYYMYYDMDRKARLDSASHIFRSILQRKQNYGPAHNGLAAVIKQRQFKYLAGFEKLEKAIAMTPLSEKDVFYNVFPDLKYYPGKRVGKMVAQQIGPSRAYLPMINTLEIDFQIPPLHHDLAMAMGSPFFRYATTFDNRQWMDIRGVGSGATGIEYIERGSHWERNVLAHEYAHLYHGRVLTYKESRRIRALYHTAKKNNRTLDYYSANNESEFFGQAYAAYLSEKKVHPLTHKSMNTHAYLHEKDPTLYAFVDSLIQKQKAYLAGNKEVMKSNWAQTYVSLTRRREPQIAKAYLDTALSFDSNYIPALLSYAEIEARGGNFTAAQKWISKAKAVNPDYGPVYVTRAYMIHQKALQNEISFAYALDKQAVLFDKALKVEHDLSARARINSTYRNRMLQYGNTAGAIKITEQYLEDPPVISTYLTDRKEEAQIFVKSLYSDLGYAQKYLTFFDELLKQNPQNFFYRLKYVDILINAQKWDKALSALKQGERVLGVSNNTRPGYVLRTARVLIQKNDASAAIEKLRSMDENSLSFNQQLYLSRLYVQLGEAEKAQSVLPDKKEAQLPLEKANRAYTQGLLMQQQKATDEAIAAFNSALKINPYHMDARATLFKLLKATGAKEEVQKIIQQAEKLTIAPGPGFNF